MQNIYYLTSNNNSANTNSALGLSSAQFKVADKFVGFDFTSDWKMGANNPICTLDNTTGYFTLGLNSYASNSTINKNTGLWVELNELSSIQLANLKHSTLDVYVIETAQQLAWLSQQTLFNNTALNGKTFVIVKDINLEGQYWTPINSGYNNISINILGIKKDKNLLTAQDLLEDAIRLPSIDLLEIDKENNTVRITDPSALIDVGAIGKGYATEKVAQYLEQKGITSYVLNIGGNIRIIGTKVDGKGWNTGIKNPLNPETYAFYTNIADTSCVTSGDYERYFVADGKKYHHIIDSETLMPANYFSSITVITKDSGLADTLSTALFCMNYEDGLELVESLGNVEVLWIYSDGSQKTTDGMISIKQ